MAERQKRCLGNPRTPHNRLVPGGTDDNAGCRTNRAARTKSRHDKARHYRCPMRVSDVRIGDVNGWPALLADVLTDGTKHRIYFAAPVDHIVKSADPFLLALYAQAAAAGESLTIEDEIDPDLCDGVDAAGAWANSWFPDLHPKGFRVDAEARPHELSLAPERLPALCLSGGVDSLFTLYRDAIRVPETHPARIRLTIGIDLFSDSPSRESPNETGADHVLSNLAPLGAELRAPLIPVRTNALALVGYRLGTVWTNVLHGALLAAVGHALANQVSSLTIASTYPVAAQHPWGSHPAVDPLYSSSYLRVKHEGVQFTRFERTQLLAEWDNGLANLHVCTRIHTDRRNCGQCEKCLRTMTALALLGRLADTPTFDADDVSPQAYDNLRIRRSDFDQWWSELESEARKRGRMDVADAIRRRYRRTIVKDARVSAVRRLRKALKQLPPATRNG